MDNLTIIKKAFNDGYLMQKQNPELAIAIANSFKDMSHPYSEGFVSGTIQLIKDKGQAIEISKSISKDKNIDKGIY